MVLGVSPDAPPKLAAFRRKYTLPFTLLSDPEHKVSEAYGTWREKSLYGRKYFGVARVTVIIGRDGRILRIFDPVKAAGHGEEVAAWLEESRPR